MEVAAERSAFEDGVRRFIKEKSPLRVELKRYGLVGGANGKQLPNVFSRLTPGSAELGGESEVDR